MSDPNISVEVWNPAGVYKRNDPRGWCGDKSRGASLGRGKPIKDIPPGYESQAKFDIRVERIAVIEGYDPNGTYFGNGGLLFWVYGEMTEITNEPGHLNHPEVIHLDYCERFVDLEDAVRIVKQTWPAANVIGSEAWCNELVEKYLDEEYEREQEEASRGSYEDMSIAEFLEECVSQPPSMPIASWNKMIERARALEAPDVEKTED